MTVAVPIAAGVLGLVAGVFVAARLAGRPLSTEWRLDFAGPRDVLVPLVSCLLCVAIGIRFGLSPVLPAYLYLALVAVPLGAIDLEQHRLPDVLTLPSYPISLALLGLAAPFTTSGGSHLIGALIGLAALGVLYLVLFLVNPNGFGFGDVKLAGVLGAYLGWLGFDTWILGVFLGFLGGGLVALVLLALRRVDKKGMIAFGPYMLAGALVAVLLSEYRILF